VTPLPRPRRGVAVAAADLLPLLPDATVTGDLTGCALTGVTLDSRAVRPGDLYAALPGARTHGARFTAAAAAAGAVAALTDPAGAGDTAAAGLPTLVVADPRDRLGAVAARVYGDPSRRLQVFGITGTNGKTTVSYLAEAGLRAAGCRTGLLGTVETRVAGETVPSVRTTPEAPDLQALLAVMVEREVRAVAMEVSSHALALGRVDGVRFAAAAFTNLSQDHLDFHGTLEDYFAAKSRLFDPGRAAVALVNADDRYGRRLHRYRPDALTFSLRDRSADWWVDEVRPAADGTGYRLHGPAGVTAAGSVRLPGTVNLANAVCATGLLVAAGLPLAAAVEGIAGLPGVPGRMERVDAGQPFVALVDYAHSPDAVDRLVATLRPLTPGRLLVVLGCGGDRDRGKRPLMGAAAARADLAVLTSDNPRSEDPAAILAEMRGGVDRVPAGRRGEVVVEPDRAAAIRLAVERARPGDTLVVAGKGHETGQEYGGVVRPFDDRLVLAEALTAVGSRA
jgi:UDP-N-acetylmuramoyl-L-alanyl-D-glutamate--2,6-diaminopimelate ligase